MATDKQQGGSRAAPPFSARHLDITAFAEAGARLADETVLSHYLRLADVVQDGDQMTPVRWQTQGSMVPVLGGSPEIWLELEAEAELPMQCQRCLEPMRQRLEVSRRFRFVQDEATAEMLDDELEDDVLVISRDFDLQALIEDELLMELPVAPRHEVCPQAPRMQVQTADFREEEAEKPNPFAALEALKKPKS
ncbi:MAG: DUF177 domain-containing protein [Ramlibacter sp.]|nr:DUF177 domain-containing protein [Ramlibacter sp.]